MRGFIFTIFAIIVILIIISAFYLAVQRFLYKKDQEKFNTFKTGSMIISSPAFQNNKKIPEKYTCDGENINPPLYFEGVPLSTQSLILIIDDPDSLKGTWVHWILYNMQPTTTQIYENAYATFLPRGTVEGNTSFGKTRYNGPCPSFGTHHYHFKLFAIDKIIDLPEGSSMLDIELALQNHIVGYAELIGLYSKK